MSKWEVMTIKDSERQKFRILPKIAAMMVIVRRRNAGIAITVLRDFVTNQDEENRRILPRRALQGIDKECVS